MKKLKTNEGNQPYCGCLLVEGLFSIISNNSPAVNTTFVSFTWVLFQNCIFNDHSFVISFLLDAQAASSL
jgi:hypothetical protein